MLIVQKYGGSSVANAERVFNVAKRIMRTRMEGNDVVVVLSAQGKTTDGLIAKAKEINAKPSRREMDMLLSTGEQQSVALMAMAISAIGGRAVSLNAAQVGIETTNTYSNARIRHINTERIENELDEGSIVSYNQTNCFCIKICLDQIIHNIHICTNLSNVSRCKSYYFNLNNNVTMQIQMIK